MDLSPTAGLCALPMSTHAFQLPESAVVVNGPLTVLLMVCLCRAQGLPLSLNGVKRIMTSMDWGDAEDFVTIGAVGAEEVSHSDMTGSPDMAVAAWILLGKHGRNPRRP